MLIKYKKTLLVLLSSLLALNIYIFKLKDTNHSVEHVNSSINSSRLSLSQIKSESLAILYLDKFDFGLLTSYQNLLKNNLEDIIVTIDSETTNKELYETVVSLKDQKKKILSKINIFKESLISLRVSESFVNEMMSNQSLKIEYLSSNNSKNLSDLLSLLSRSRVDELDKITILKQNLFQNINELDYESYKKVELLFNHIGIIIKNKRKAISSINSFLTDPLEATLSILSKEYNSYETLIIKGHLNIFKLALLLNTAFVCSFLFLLFFTKQIVTNNQSKEKDSVQLDEMANIFSSFSHRVKNPMNGILGMMSLIKSTPLNEEQEQYIQGIEQSSNYLSSLLQDLVEYSKLKSGDARVNYKSVKFFEKSNQDLDHLRDKSSEKKLKFSTKCSKDFPTKLFIDYDKLQIIVENLVDNAIKYTDNGFVLVKYIFEKIGEGHGKLIVEIEDSGMGINESSVDELLASIKNNNEVNQTDCSGLGISICYELLKLMGGELSLTSQADLGTKFTITLQVQVDTSKEKNIIVTNKVEILDSFNVLVAEDEKINQKVITGLLKKLNQNVTLVSNGVELVETFKPDEFDLIFVDMIMPEMDGLEATRILNQKFSKKLPPIIALSGNEKDKYLSKCIEVGMVDFISKPIKKNEIKNILLKYCSKKSREKVA